MLVLLTVKMRAIVGNLGLTYVYLVLGCCLFRFAGVVNFIISSGVTLVIAGSLMQFIQLHELFLGHVIQHPWVERHAHCFLLSLVEWLQLLRQVDGIVLGQNTITIKSPLCKTRIVIAIYMYVLCKLKIAECRKSTFIAYILFD